MMAEENGSNTRCRRKEAMPANLSLSDISTAGKLRAMTRRNRRRGLGGCVLAASTFQISRGEGVRLGAAA
jgi:hypothetical protein